MTLVFVCENRFIKIGDCYYVDSQSFGDALWERYLNVFDNITVFARVEELMFLPNKRKIYFITNEKVSFVNVPCFIGPKQYFYKRAEVMKVVAENAISGRAYICRVPGQIGALVSAALRRRKIPYGVEVVGDPWDVFAPGSVKHPLSPLFRIMGYYTLRKIVSRSNAALYVTKSQLQKRYPVSKGVYTTYASNVILKDEHMRAPQKMVTSGECVKLLAVGSLEQMYKSPDVAVETVAVLKKRKVNCFLTWIGDGKFRKDIENLALRLGVADLVSFKGNVSSDIVRQELANADIFIHISRTEGLPRAVIEAMGAGLPCIGSRVGGIPELLDDIALVKEIKPDIVADKIEEFVDNIEFAQSQAKRNFEEAKLYREILLNKKRTEFYQEILNICEQ